LPNLGTRAVAVGTLPLFIAWFCKRSPPFWRWMRQ
jgi:ABC-type multidrug transport system permease subunit